jgi:hypothetical protein
MKFLLTEQELPRTGCNHSASFRFPSFTAFALIFNFAFAFEFASEFTFSFTFTLAFDFAFPLELTSCTWESRDRLYHNPGTFGSKFEMRANAARARNRNQLEVEWEFEFEGEGECEVEDRRAAWMIVASQATMQSKQIGIGNHVMEVSVPNFRSLRRSRRIWFRLRISHGPRRPRDKQESPIWHFSSSGQSLS